MDIKQGHEEEHGEEHGDEADDDRFALVVGNEHDAAKDTSSPDDPNECQSLPHSHDAVVPECVENSNVPVNCYDQKVADGGDQRDTNHGVKNVVHVLDEVVVDG